MNTADSLFVKASEIREKVLGTEHPVVAQSLYNRAMYVEQPKVRLAFEGADYSIDRKPFDGGEGETLRGRCCLMILL